LRLLEFEGTAIAARRKRVEPALGRWRGGLDHEGRAAPLLPDCLIGFLPRLDLYFAMDAALEKDRFA
jgi:hypothetical protein